MPILLQWSERTGCGATIKLDNGDVVYVSIAAARVSVRQWDLSGLFSAVTSRFFGPKLFRQSNAAKNERTAKALRFMFPQRTPALPRFNDPLLAAFANAVWHCGSAEQVRAVLGEAAAKSAEQA